MAIDITTFGVKKVRKNIDGIIYNNNTRNNLRYYIQFINPDIHDESSAIKMTYRVIQIVKQNTIAVPTGEWLNNISYQYVFMATKDVFVDKNGNIVGALDPLVWGTEYDFLLTLLTANDANGSNMIDFQKLLFDRGILDFPQNKSI